MRDRWRAGTGDKLRDRQDRGQQARENRPLRRRLQRLRQRVAELRRRLTMLDTAMKAVERAIERLGFVEAAGAADAAARPRAVAVEHHTQRRQAHRPPTTPRRPPRAGRGRQAGAAAVLDNTDGFPRSPAAGRWGAPAGCGTRRFARNSPAPAIGLGPDRRGVRWRFPPVTGAFGVRTDGRGDGVKRLVLQAVDPELLEAVVGPQLAPAWVKPLRAQYARFKQAYPADWVDVEEVWRKQRARRRSKAGPHLEQPHREQPADQPVPPRPPAPAVGGRQGAAAARARPLENRPQPSRRTDYLGGVPHSCRAA